MIITSDQVMLSETSQILDNSEYLTESESMFTPIMVPIIENARLGGGIVDNNDIIKLTESYGCSYSYAIQSIAEANGINYDDIIVSIDESDAILNPDLTYVYENYIIRPISNNDPVYRLMESVVYDAINETVAIYQNGDKQIELNTDNPSYGINKQQYENMGYKLVGGYNGETNNDATSHEPITHTSTPAATNTEKTTEEAKKDVENDKKNGKDSDSQAETIAKKAETSKDPNFIVKAISALRKIYRDFLHRAKKMEYKYQHLSGPEKAKFADRPNILKRIAAKILGWIDRLMSKLQKFADRRKGSEMTASERRMYKFDNKLYGRKNSPNSRFNR